LKNGHELLEPQLNRDLEFAGALADQLQGRAQVIGSTVTILLAAVGLVVSADPGIGRTLHDNHLEPLAVAGLLTLLVCLLLSFAVALPRRTAVIDPQWYSAVLGSQHAYTSLTSDDLTQLSASFERQIGLIRAEAFSLLIRSNTIRARLLATALVLLALTTVAISYGTFVVVRSG
jgi:hypothetical protein